MEILFYLVNGAISTMGLFLVFKRFSHFGLLAAGIAMTVGSLISMAGNAWWPMLASVGGAFLLHRLIGDPVNA